jgi:hypothetical protein
MVSRKAVFVCASSDVLLYDSRSMLSEICDSQERLSYENQAVAFLRVSHDASAIRNRRSGFTAVLQTLGNTLIQVIRHVASKCRPVVFNVAVQHVTITRLDGFL